jgi:hypothetical protein
VHIAGRKQLFTSWGVHITGRNQAFSSAVEKLGSHCPGMETNINGGIQAIYCAEYIKIPPVSAALKFAEISHYNEGSNNSTKWLDER